MELMDHETAIQNKASERYVLGDLPAGERDAFEEHFSDCTRCMEDVSLASTFAANAKAVFRDRAHARQAPRSTFLQWLFASPVPAFAAVVLAVVMGYQNLVVIPEGKAPRAAIASVTLDGETRSALPQVKAGDALRVQMAFDRAAGTGTVFTELMDTLGNRLSGGPVTAPGPNQPLDLYFPVKVRPGRYTVVLRADKDGRAGQEILRSSFEVTTQETKNP
jgi:anti-sigma factor RsiW